MPQPANSVARVRSTIPQRRATHSSPSPSAPSQPIGPAYQPRSKPSCSSISARATSRGYPPTAGVGWSSPASAEQPAALRQRARDLGREVLDELAGVMTGLRATSSVVGDRREQRADRVDDDRVLLAVLLAGEQPASERRRPRRRRRRAGSCPRRRPSGRCGPRCRTSRSGVAPRNVRPSRRNAYVVLSGALGRRRRRALATSSSTGERMPTRRASTTLSIRPRPTAPANMPDQPLARRRCAGCSSRDGKGREHGLAHDPVGLGGQLAGALGSVVHRASRGHRRRRRGRRDGRASAARCARASCGQDERAAPNGAQRRPPPARAR